MTKKEISDLFIKLCEIPSPTRREKAVADFIENYLKGVDWKVWRDKASEKTGSNTGNLYALLDIGAKKTVAFSAHMDTVQGENDEVKVKFDGKIFKSDGTTILGADDKAGITALLVLAKEIDRKKLKTNLLFFFPTTEEEGKMGSSLFDPGALDIDFVFNVDIGEAPGTFIYKGLSYQDFTIELKGKAAHAAISYEKGKDANLAAAKLISSLPVGKDAKAGTTFNIGKIEGGSKMNIVSDYAVVKGEYRAFEGKNMVKLEKVVRKACEDIERKTGVKVKFILEKGTAPPMVGTKNSDIVKIAKKAARTMGLKVSVEESFSSSDANNYSGLGFQTVSVARGGKNPHGKDEELKLSQLEKAIRLLENITLNV